MKHIMWHTPMVDRLRIGLWVNISTNILCCRDSRMSATEGLQKQRHAGQQAPCMLRYKLGRTRRAGSFLGVCARPICRGPRLSLVSAGTAATLQLPLHSWRYLAEQHPC